MWYWRPSNLVADDTNGVYDVFVRDQFTGIIRRVSVASSGAQGTAASHTGVISAEGRYVAFYSHASNLVPDFRTCSSGTR